MLIFLGIHLHSTNDQHQHMTQSSMRIRAGVRNLDKYDMRIILGSLIDPPECIVERVIWRLFKRKSVAEILQPQEPLYIPASSQPGKISYIVFSKITKDSIFIELFQELAQLMDSCEGFATRDSYLSDEFFDGMQKSAMIIKGLLIVRCNIGNSMASKLSRLDLSKIVILRIWEDRIGNKGMKELMKLSMPELIAIEFSPTKMTNDMLRLFSKRDSNSFNEVSFYHILSFDANLFLKHLTLASSERKSNLLSTSFSWGSENVGPFIGLLAKATYKLEEPQRLVLILFDQDQQFHLQLIRLLKVYPKRLINIFRGSLVIKAL